MSKSRLLAFLLVTFAGAGPALAHVYPCYHRHAIGPCAPSWSRSGHFIDYWGAAPLRYAKPHDPWGEIVLEGAAGAGAPEGD
jgi:hypothetical protein